MKPKRVIILGAAGRDFHNFNTCYRDNPNHEVVAFTANQIPDIAGRTYPPSLAGSRYPEGIPIYPEHELSRLIPELEVDQCIFSYSDISNQEVMSTGARVNSAGADFVLLSPAHTMVKSRKPVISVGAVRTGCGKSQTSRKIVEICNRLEVRVVAIRHPMPYGNLSEQRVQRFARIEDLEQHKCTIEEMEEYEPYIAQGNVIYAGVDYGAILEAAENDSLGCDIILWDGGNNDFPFYHPDLHITVTDPHRVGHELSYYPAQITLGLSDVVIINKVDSADTNSVAQLKNNISLAVPDAVVIEAESSIQVDDPSVIKGNRVLVVEDGPTLTHGGMKIGAGTVAAERLAAQEIIDPRPYLRGTLKDTFDQYPEIGTLLPAMGYGNDQLKDLERTIQNTPCDGVVIGTPIDLSRVIDLKKPFTRVRYDLKELGKPNLEETVIDFIKKHKIQAVS